MKRVAEYDRSAQRQLIHRLIDRVRKTTRALARDPADADDAAQLSLLEVLRSAAAFRGDGPLEAWSDRICVRTTLRYVKTRARECSRVQCAIDPDGVPGEVDDDGYLVDGLPRDLTEYLARLSDERRTCIVLRYVLGHSIDEIADLTAVSRNTVKDRLLQARRQFRQMIRRDRTVVGASRELTGRTIPIVTARTG